MADSVKSRREPDPSIAAGWAAIAAQINATHLPSADPDWRPGAPPAASTGPDPHGWGAIVDGVNAQLAPPREGPQPSGRPSQGLRGNEALPWAAVAAQVNRENGAMP